MALPKVPILEFVAYLRWGLRVHCGYIMGSYGQDPKKWSVDSWWFTQYTNASQRAKALYWRTHAPAVHDCNGISEGCYLQKTGVNINSRARNNYATWCSPKGTGKIPNKYKVPGAAVFKDNGSYVHHVGFLLEPVDASNPNGDWWVCEAKGVMYGWVLTRLSASGWNKWGLMTLYFDYTAVLTADKPTTTDPVEFGHRTLRVGMDGPDVKALQLSLIALDYSCGKAGADGDFGPKTESAVKAFQEDHKLTVDGIVGPKTVAVLNDALPEDGEDSAPVEEKPATIKVTGGSVYVRTQPSASGAKLGVVHKGDKLTATGETADGWRGVTFNGERAWITTKYTEVIA